jgi:ubiquinone/menaquinone biosynthesis C-methylase UbiE
MKDNASIKKAVRDGYGKIARGERSSCCGPSSCCGSPGADTISKTVGYSDDEINSVPDGANLGLGCGNPIAHASLKEGEVVLDLGSGGGFDAFLAARRVGATGKVIGVDMTSDMIERARRNAAKGGYANVEFRLGEIEHLPVDDNSVDVIISNCVINLSPDKEKVFKEALRALKPGGRLMVSDLVLERALPQKIRKSVEAYVGCLAGALLVDDYLAAIKAAGFADVEIQHKASYPLDAMANDAAAQIVSKNGSVTNKDIEELEGVVVSIKVKAVKRLQ